MKSSDPNINKLREALRLSSLDIGDKPKLSDGPPYGSSAMFTGAAMAFALFFYRENAEDIACSVFPEITSKMLLEMVVGLVYLWSFVWINVHTTLNLWKHLLQKVDRHNDIIVNVQLLGLLGFIIGYLGCTVWLNVKNFWVSKSSGSHSSAEIQDDLHVSGLYFSVSPATGTLFGIILCCGGFMGFLEYVMGKDVFIKLKLKMQ